MKSGGRSEESAGARYASGLGRRLHPAIRRAMHVRRRAAPFRASLVGAGEQRDDAPCGTRALTAIPDGRGFGGVRTEVDARCADLVPVVAPTRGISWVTGAA